MVLPVLLGGCVGGMGQVVTAPPDSPLARLDPPGMPPWPAPPPVPWPGGGRGRPVASREGRAVREEVAARGGMGPGVLVFFGRDGTSLDRRSRAELDRFLAQAGGGAGLCLVVSGHADTREGARDAGGLSRARADAVLAYLAAAGMAQGRVRLDAEGDARPLVPHPGATGWEPHNSRAEAHLGRTCRADVA